MARSPLKRFSQGFPGSNRFQDFGNRFEQGFPGQTQLPPVFGSQDRQSLAPNQQEGQTQPNFQQPIAPPPIQENPLPAAPQSFAPPSLPQQQFVPQQPIQQPFAPQQQFTPPQVNMPEQQQFTPQPQQFGSQKPLAGITTPGIFNPQHPNSGQNNGIVPPQTAVPMPKPGFNAGFKPPIGPTSARGEQGQLQGMDNSHLTQPNLTELLGTAFGGGDPFAGLVQETGQFEAPAQIDPNQLLQSLNLPQQAQQTPQVPPNLAAILQQFRGGAGNFRGGGGNLGLANSGFGTTRNLF